MIGLIDYGMGNLYSVKNALEKAGGEVIISNDPAVLEKCTHLVLPGVGAFGDMVKALKQNGLDAFIKDQVKNQDKKLLGICLGMQALFEKSYEKGDFDGLGLLKGSVVKMDSKEGLRIPQIGWNELDFRDEEISGLYEKAPWFYFDHSYYADGMDPQDITAIVEYGPYKVPAIVKKGNIIGVQGHPEKSAQGGLKLLEWFARWK